MLDEQEKQLISQFLNETLKEKRRARYWRGFSRFLIVGIVILFLGMTVAGDRGISIFPDEHTAVVRLNGPIIADFMASSDNINQALRNAYENDLAKAVILEINTPGGSPVQSGRIYTEIQRLQTQYPDKPLYAVISDLCASGGIYVAAAAKAIYADQASVVGSIGVIMSGFGLEKAIEKLGVERRVMTAGEHKAMLDSFLPRDPTEVEHAQTLLDQMHQQFIQRVKQGRGERLSKNADLFSGLVWTGEAAKDLGLVDDFGDVHYVAKEVIGQENIIDYTVDKPVWEQLTEQGVRILLEQWRQMTMQTQIAL